MLWNGMLNPTSSLFLLINFQPSNSFITVSALRCEPRYKMFTRPVASQHVIHLRTRIIDFVQTRIKDKIWTLFAVEFENMTSEEKAVIEERRRKLIN